MKLYNTLTRKIEDIRPLAAPAIGIYTCGPTVYDYAHIGHWFNYVRMDMLVRTLAISGLEPKWVMNITDVGHLVSDADDGEDKLQKGARREGKTAWEVAEVYTADFLEGMQQLNIQTPQHIVKATEHIAEQIVLIQTLELKGFSYVIDDGVYYDTSKFAGYAAFARLDLDEQQAGARVVFNKQKRNPTDFALWKLSPQGQQRDMEWESPWGKGFPGWHIECSAMSMKYLGTTLDIHTGGIDHIQVHHTNEIAQSEAATGKRFANYWMHSNHVTVNGEKIAKSSGNGIRLQEITEKGISTQAVRLHILESHYRSQSKFSWESLEAAQNRLQAYQAMADLRWQPIDASTSVHYNYTGPDYAAFQQKITEALAHDLDTPRALALLSIVEGGAKPLPDDTVILQEFNSFLAFIDTALGLELQQSTDITNDQKELITRRQKARTAKDWEASDKLRDTLVVQGIGVRDTPQGSIWFRL